MFIEGCPGFSDDDAAYRAMDFLLGALEEIASEIFYSAAHLLNLDVGIVFAVTTAAYWEMEVAAGLAETPAEDEDEDSLPEEEGARLTGHSKDSRDDLPQVVIAMAVTRDGIPVRCWTFPGDTADQKIIRKVKDDLGGWSGSPTAGSPPQPTGLTWPAAAGTTSTPRSSVTPAAKPRPRWPAPLFLDRLPTICGSPASLRCQASSVAGVTGKTSVQRRRGSSGATAANHTRSAGSYWTRPACRRRTASSCRTTSSSAFFAMSTPAAMAADISPGGWR